MVWTTQLINKHGIDLIGFQEFEPAQYQKFASLMGSGWDLWPASATAPSASNSIAWRTSEWTAVAKRTYKAPYFYGKMQERPLVQLRNNATGQLVWVLNTHNPADTRGNAQKWRDQSERIQAALVNSLRQPDVPVIFVGDMNDRDRFYCPVTYLTDLESASGGYHEDVPNGACELARPALVDWIMGTSDLAFSGYSVVGFGSLPRSSRPSDHSLIYSDATVDPTAAARAGIKRVVVVDVEGLRPGVVTARRTPWLARMREHGATALAGRTVESPAALPNMVSMVTGRPVRVSAGGHGVKASSTRSTVQHTSGRYVSSIFDVAHNLGLSTALYSGDPRSKFLVRSWGRSHGGGDPYGKNNGRSKFSIAKVSGKDSKAIRAARAQLAKNAPRLTFVQLGQAAGAGQRSGFNSARYYRSLRASDARVGSLLRTISRHQQTAGSTLVIVTASTNGLRSSKRYAVPILVWGHGVARASLYTLNPAYAYPRSARPSYRGRQPIRNGDVANLVTSSLRIPAVPGSRFNSRQRLNVFGPAIARASAARDSAGR
jgi:hypothetical protein